MWVNNHLEPFLRNLVFVIIGIRACIPWAGFCHGGVTVEEGCYDRVGFVKSSRPKYGLHWVWKKEVTLLWITSPISMDLQSAVPLMVNVKSERGFLLRWKNPEMGQRLWLMSILKEGPYWGGRIRNMGQRGYLF